MSGIPELVRKSFCGHAEAREERGGEYRLMGPFYHEDGDMITIFLRPSPHRPGWVRICDKGDALMRLSYYLDLTPARERILQALLVHHGAQEEDGELWLECPGTPEELFAGVQRFVALVQKVCSLRWWRREIVRSAFYEDLHRFVFSRLEHFDPKENFHPLPDIQEVSVDYALKGARKRVFLYGVGSEDKAKSTAISLLEILKQYEEPFVSMVVYEDMEKISAKTRRVLTRNADKQFPSLRDMEEMGVQEVERLAA